LACAYYARGIRWTARGEWQAQLLHFSLIYLMCLIGFFSYRLFDWDTFANRSRIPWSLAGSTVYFVL